LRKIDFKARFFFWTQGSQPRVLATIEAHQENRIDFSAPSVTEADLAFLCSTNSLRRSLSLISLLNPDEVRDLASQTSSHDRDLEARSVRFFLKCSSRSVELSAGRPERDKGRSWQNIAEALPRDSRKIAGSDKEAAFGFYLARAVVGSGGPPIFRSGWPP
jgi:hypothetical protein